MLLEEITEVEADIGALEVTITTTLLEELTMDVTQAQDRNVIWNYHVSPNLKLQINTQCLGDKVESLYYVDAECIYVLG